MRLFLTVAPDSAVTASSPDTVALFDDGVWTRSGPSHDAVAQVSATFVAQEIHRQAALTELVYRSKDDVVCFRYGPRPPPQADFVFFHKRHVSLSGARQTSPLTRPVPSLESAGMSSPLVTPSTSLSSDRSARSLPSSSLVKSVEQSALPSVIPTSSAASATLYASVFSLWVVEVLTVKRQHVTVCGCLLTVLGVAVDLTTGQEIHAPLNVHLGTQRTLRCADDVHAYLAQCEATIKEFTSAHTPPVPFHMWMTVRIGGVSAISSPAEELPSVTFLDLASPITQLRGEGQRPNSGSVEHAREQLRLFERQAGATAAAAPTTSASAQLPSPYKGSSATADRRWLGFLQSCQLSRARKVGIFSFALTSPKSSVFDLTTTELGCDPFAVSADLRQRALEDAVNFGVIHPQHSSTRARLRRLKQKKVKKHTAGVAEITPPKMFLNKSASPSSQHIESILDKSPQLPTLKRATASFASRHVRSAQSGGEASPSEYRSNNNSNANTARVVDLFGLLDAEEYIARGALEDSEARARDLAWMRWALRAHPPNTSVTDVARQLSSAVSRLERPKVRSAPLRRPPPLTRDDLAATARAPSGHSSSNSQRHPHALAPTRTPQSPEVVREALPLISPPPSSSHAVSSIPSPFCGRASALTSATIRPTLHPEFLIAGESPRAVSHRRHGSPSSGAVSPQISASPSRATSGTRRRYSALEVALLERAHSCTQRGSPTTSPHNGSDVELLYPLVRTFHAELTAQDNVMAEELMARSKIELRELNRRRTLESLAAERGEAAAATSRPPLPQGRRYSASPRASRAFLDV